MAGKRKPVFRTHVDYAAWGGMRVHIGIYLRNPLSGNMHWGEKARHKDKFNAAVVNVDRPLAVTRIVFVRWSPAKLDSHDNLRVAFKWVCDAACEWLGLPNDADGCGVDLVYEQQQTFKIDGKPAEHGITVRFE